MRLARSRILQLGSEAELPGEGRGGQGALLPVKDKADWFTCVEGKSDREKLAQLRSSTSLCASHHYKTAKSIKSFCELI